MQLTRENLLSLNEITCSNITESKRLNAERSNF